MRIRDVKRFQFHVGGNYNCFRSPDLYVSVLKVDEGSSLFRLHVLWKKKLNGEVVSEQENLYVDKRKLAEWDYSINGAS